MNKLFIIIFLMFFSVNFLAQKTPTTSKDTNEMCIPYFVAQKILLDLNEYDKLREIVMTYQNEILQLNKKTEFLKKENDTWVTENKLNEEIILEKNKVIEIYTSENNDLKKENKRIKTKNTLYNIISVVIIAPLTYLALFK